MSEFKSLYHMAPTPTSIKSSLILVLESPVWSGFLALRAWTETETSLPSSQNRKRPDRTTKDQRPWSFSVFRPVLVLTGPNWSKTGLLANIFKLWIGKFINIYLNVKTSPRTLIYVENWCSYENILVHLLFSIVFYSFNHIFVNSGPINMFLGAF